MSKFKIYGLMALVMSSIHITASIQTRERIQVQPTLAWKTNKPSTTLDNNKSQSVQDTTLRLLSSPILTKHQHNFLCLEKIEKSLKSKDAQGLETARLWLSGKNLLEIYTLTLTALHEHKHGAALWIIQNFIKPQQTQLTRQQKATLLELALESKNLELARTIVPLCKDIFKIISDTVSVMNRSLKANFLDKAGQLGDLNIIIEILQMGNYMSSTSGLFSSYWELDNDIGPALTSAVKAKHYNLIDDLLKSDKKIQIDDGRNLPSQSLAELTAKSLESAIIQAIAQHDNQAAIKLLEHKSQQAYNPSGLMGMRNAGEHNNLPMIKYFISIMDKNNANKEIQAYHKGIALTGAIISKHVNLAQYLLSPEAGESITIGKDTLAIAGKHGLNELIPLIVSRPEYQNNVTEQYNQSVCEAAATAIVHGHPDTTELLFDQCPHILNKESMHEKTNIIDGIKRMGYWDLATKLNPEIYTEFKESITDKIEKDQDLSETDKDILLDFYDKLENPSQFKNNPKAYLKKLIQHPASSLSPSLLKRHAPILLHVQTWLDHRNQSHKTQWSAEMIAAFYNTMSPTNSGTYEEPELTQIWNPRNPLTQTLHQNLVQNTNALWYTMVPEDGTGQKNATYYHAGYALDILKSGIYDQIKACEDEAQAQKSEPFYHARNWEWNFVSDIFNLIVALQNNKDQLSDRVYLRYRSQDCNIGELKQYRRDLLAQGATQHLGTGTDKTGRDAEITCVNKSILSNSGHHGECSGTYFLENHSIAAQKTGWEFVKRIFEQQGLSHYYEHYLPELEQLYKLHETSSSLGELLAIIIKDNCVDELLYPAVSGGIKADTQGLTPSQLVAQTKQQAQTDPNFTDKTRQFYCLAVSDIPGEYGNKYTIKSLNEADPVKYGLYKNKRDKLFAQMKAQYQAQQ